MTSRSHSYSTGPTTSNCDRYSATFFHPLPSATTRLPPVVCHSLKSFFSSSSNSLPRSCSCASPCWRFWRGSLPAQEYSNCFLNKENTTTQKKTFADHPPEPKDQSLFWISPGLFGSLIFSFLRLLYLQTCLLGLLGRFHLLLPFGEMPPDLPKTGRQKIMAWLDWVQSCTSPCM